MGTINHYVPKAGDIVYIDFDPSTGKEIQKRRPGLVVSVQAFNEKMGFATVMPITSTPQDELWAPQVHGKVSGWVCTWQPRALDYHARSIRYVERASSDVLEHAKVVLKQIHDIK